MGGGGVRDECEYSTCLIKHRGVYFFELAGGCDVYSRAAFIMLALKVQSYV